MEDCRLDVGDDHLREQTCEHAELRAGHSRLEQAQDRPPALKPVLARRLGFPESGMLHVEASRSRASPPGLAFHDEHGRTADVAGPQSGEGRVRRHERERLHLRPNR